MGNKRYTRVMIYKKDGTTWESSGTVLTDAYKVEVTRGIGKIKDIFQFNILNSHNRYYKSGATQPGEDDRIQIWFWKNKLWANLTTSQQNDALVMDGVITDVMGSTQTSKELSIRGSGFFDIVMKGMVFVRDNTLTTSDAIIRNIIAQLNGYNPNRVIYGANLTEWNNMGNTVLTNDIQYTSSYKSSVEVIEELSSNKYTGDGAYKFFIKYNPTDERYEFRWNKKDNVADGAFIYGTDNCYKLNLKNNKEGVINAVIYNVGLDCNNISWDFLHYDPSETVKGGAAWKYMTDTQNIMPDLLITEFEADETLWETTPDGLRKENYPSDGEYPWTFQFETRDEAGIKSGTLATAADDDEFNDAIVSEAKWIGRDIAAKLIDTFGDAKWGGDLDIPQVNSTEGDLLDMTASIYNLSNEKLRVERIRHDIFTTTKMLTKDEKSVGT